MTEPTVGELTRMMGQLAGAIDKLSSKVDAIPTAIDQTYVRKDVAEARWVGLEKEQESFQKETVERFDKLSTWGRWLVAGVITPIAIQILIIVTQYSGGGK